MSPTSQARNTKKPAIKINKSKVDTKRKEAEFANRRAIGLNSGIILSNMTAVIGAGVPVVGLQHAAQLVATIFAIAEKVYANREDFEIIAHDASDLVIAIYELQQKAEDPKKWLSPDLREMVDGLTKNLKTVKRVAEQLNKRNKITRIIFYMADGGKIRQTRDNIRSAVEKFQVLSNIKMNDLLLEMKTMQQNLSKQMENRNDTDNARKEREGLEDEDEEEEQEEEEDEDDVEDEEDIDDDDDEPATPVTKRRTRSSRVKTAPTPPTSTISGFSFSNSGSGQIYNQNVGNTVNTTYSNVGNNHSKNYVYG